MNILHFFRKKEKSAAEKQAQIKRCILSNVVRQKAKAIIPYVEEIAEDDALMTLVNTYGHIADMFFINCKKMSQEKYQHYVLDCYLDSSVVKRTNLIFYLFMHRAQDIKFEIWERMVKDESFHSSIYFFFERTKEKPAYWEKLVTFFHEKKFAVIPCSSKLEKYLLIEKELFQY